ncbi:carbon storage regulator [Mediterraneibacter sp. NSJ-55]|uniref:Translational regulator CsrA n=1 Tax=Mediterraneibacter hominis TaxID=2763054 RepID=A0A923LJE8_9FIRM|nr:carbon storage regulator [Mediterraneibacter hominis]MBC5689375.1 carbon storage regulator [Mediterraneibacter hominis]
MLILGRKKGEEIVINDNIIITVKEVGADSVKLAIEAPRDVPVLRKELIEAARENKEAAAGQKDISGLKALMEKRQ